MRCFVSPAVPSAPADGDRADGQNEQRQRRKDEAAAGTRWELKHFKHIDEDPICTYSPPKSYARRF